MKCHSDRCKCGRTHAACVRCEWVLTAPSTSVLYVSNSMISGTGMLTSSYTSDGIVHIRFMLAGRQIEHIQLAPAQHLAFTVIGFDQIIALNEQGTSSGEMTFTPTYRLP